MWGAWQVGLDIQAHYMCAVAAQRKRNGWHLRHWWEYRFLSPVLFEGHLQQTKELHRVLREWRMQLPRHISLRIAFPAQRILQQTMAQPDARLWEPERSDYLQLSTPRKFPFDPQMIVVDHRTDPQQTDLLRLTAARRDELENWLSCLQQAGLQPDVVEIPASVLRQMVHHCGLNPASPLLHGMGDHWLWVTAQNSAFMTGQLDVLQDDLQGKNLFARLQNALHPLVFETAYYSADHESTSPEGFKSWIPWQAFVRTSPPLPLWSGLFTLATALALREQDRIG